MAKIMPRHLDRKAYIYVRQSSPAQVMNHQESTRRQYQLCERAMRLGWPEQSVDTIDEDQGKSGATAEGRSGFQRMVSDVALGQVGAIVGLEVSRLARSCADWYRLLEVAALAGALIIDEEGVYDPNQYNDRLLLGLKGTLSEAELHFLKQRMITARCNKIRRGEFRIPIPVGYVWDPTQGIRMDPDERVRDTVALFFSTFERLGAALAVVRDFRKHRQMFPRRNNFGSLTTAPTWRHLRVARAVHMLRNPSYAGVYSYARNHAESEDPEDVSAGGRIWLPNAHDAYISLEQYEANVARLVSNRGSFNGMAGKGSPRKGKSLLQGIVLCGVCGRRMQIAYSPGERVNYWCRRPEMGPCCQWIPGEPVDETVKCAVLETLNREELNLAMKVFDKVAQRNRELQKQWEKRIESAQYEAERAARRYHSVEPENRLVVRTLEQEWNECLREVERVEEKYRRAQESLPLSITDEQREQILTLTQDIPRLWDAPTTQHQHRKQLVRLLIEDVTLRAIDDPWHVEVAIRWKTNVVSRHEAMRPLRRPQTTSTAVVARIEALYRDHTDEEIAKILNDEGHLTGHRKRFTVGRVAHIRHRRHFMKHRPTETTLK